MKIEGLVYLCYRTGVRLGQLIYYNCLDDYESYELSAEARVVSADLRGALEEIGQILPLNKTTITQVLTPKGIGYLVGLYHYQGGLDRTTALIEEFRIALDTLVPDNELKYRARRFFEVGIEIAKQWPNYYDEFGCSERWSDPERINNLLSPLALTAKALIDLESTEEEREASENASTRRQYQRIGSGAGKDLWYPIEAGLEKLRSSLGQGFNPVVSPEDEDGIQRIVRKLSPNAKKYLMRLKILEAFDQENSVKAAFVVEGDLGSRLSMSSNPDTASVRKAKKQARDLGCIKTRAGGGKNAGVWLTSLGRSACDYMDRHSTNLNG